MKMSALEYISVALFPRRCALCGKVVPPDMPVCDRCEADLEYVKGEICPHCGREKKYCSCSSHRRFFESQTAPFYYSGAAKRSVHALKFDGCVQNAVGLARFMSDSVKKNFAGVKFDFVCCVPLSESSLKKRGYNQSALLAKEIAKELGVPFEEKLLSRTVSGKGAENIGRHRALRRSHRRVRLRRKTKLQKMPQFCSATIYQQRERRSTSAQSSCFCAARIKYIASARR